MDKLEILGRIIELEEKSNKLLELEITINEPIKKLLDDGTYSWPLDPRIMEIIQIDSRLGLEIAELKGMILDLKKVVANE